MEAHRRATGRPTRGSTHLAAIERDRQAFVAAPRRADAKQSKLVDKGVHCGAGNWLQGDSEEPTGASEIALPKCVLRVRWERRMPDLRDFRPLLQPAGDNEPCFVVLLEPNT